MKPVSTLLREYRSNRSQREVALKTGISQRTLQRAEGGDSIDLETIRKCAVHYELKGDALATLLTAWAKQALGAYAPLLMIRPLRQTKRSPVDLATQCLDKLPVRQQRQLAEALTNPNIRRIILSVNATIQQLRMIQSENATKMATNESEKQKKRKITNT